MNATDHSAIPVTSTAFTTNPETARPTTRWFWHNWNWKLHSRTTEESRNPASDGEPTAFFGTAGSFGPPTRRPPGLVSEQCLQRGRDPLDSAPGYKAKEGCGHGPHFALRTGPYMGRTRPDCPCFGGMAEFALTTDTGSHLAGSSPPRVLATRESSTSCALRFGPGCGSGGDRQLRR